MRVIRTVHGGDALPSASETRSLIDRYVTGRPKPDASNSATPPCSNPSPSRKSIRCRLVARALSNVQIATLLATSLPTAKTQVNRTMMTLGAHDRAQLVIIADESGLLRGGRK